MDNEVKFSTELKCLRRTPLYLSNLNETQNGLTNSEKAKLALTENRAHAELPSMGDDALNDFIEMVFYDDQEGVRNYFEKIQAEKIQEAQAIFFREFDIIDLEGKKIKGFTYQIAYWMRNDAMCELLEKHMTAESKRKMRHIIESQEPENEPCFFQVNHMSVGEKFKAKINERVVEEDEQVDRRSSLVRKRALTATVISCLALFSAITALIFLLGAPSYIAGIVLLAAVFGSYGFGRIVGILVKDYKKAQGVSPETVYAGSHCGREVFERKALAQQYQFFIQSPVLRLPEGYRKADYKQFLKAAGSDNFSVRIIDLSNKKLTARNIWRACHRLLGKSSIETLALSGNPNLGDDLIPMLAEGSRQLVPSLSNLFLDNTGMTLKSFESIEKMLLLKKQLRILSLRHNNLNDECILALINALKKQGNALHVLNLGDNTIGNEGVKAIASWIEANPELKVLDLSANPFDNEGARQLLRALEKNTNLECLHLPESIESDLRREINEKLKGNVAVIFNPDSRRLSCV